MHHIVDKHALINGTRIAYGVHGQGEPVALIHGTPSSSCIWRKTDAWQVVAWAHKLHDAIPNSKLHILNGCGHFAMEDKPAEVSRHLIDFLAANSSQATA